MITGIPSSTRFAPGPHVSAVGAARPSDTGGERGGSSQKEIRPSEFAGGFKVQ